MSSLADLPELIGFFSYAREDDEAYKGRLSTLRAEIQAELGALLGRSKATFRLWQDKAAIAPGKLWEAEIKTAVAQAVFFIPIVTPRSVNSPYCKFEFDAFLAREQALGRTDLVFPIVYVPVPALANPALQTAHPVVSTIARRQYVDWQTFRYIDTPTPAMREAIGDFCRTIVEALSQAWLPPEERQQQVEREAERRAQDERRRREVEAEQREEEDARRKRDEAQAQAQRRVAELREQEAEAKRRAHEDAARKLAEAEALRRAEDEQRRRAAQAKPHGDEEPAFAIAERADAVSALDGFIAAFPGSFLVAKAKELRTTLMERNEAYAAAMSSDDPAVLKTFLARFWASKPAEDVRRRLDRLEPPPGPLKMVGWFALVLLFLLVAGGGIVMLAMNLFPWRR